MKKFLTYSVVIATIAWSIGLSAVLPVAAAYTPTDGDLIKTATYPAVYYVSGGKKYLFVNRVTFGTWRDNFNGLKVVSQVDFDSVNLGGNVTARPGVSLVKFDNSANVYAVTPGAVLVKLENDAAKTALYGSAAPIVIQSSFEANYTKSASVLTATSQYPNGTLIKSGTATYLVLDGKLSMLTGDAYTANFLKASYEHTVADVSGYTAGSAITGKVDSMSSIVAGAGAATPVATVGSLSVAVASDSPVSTNVIADSTGNEYPQAVAPFLKVNFTAPSDGDAKVTSVKFTRSGISADTDLGSLYLYDGNTRLAEYSAFNDKVVTFSDSNGLFTVPKGTTRSITLKADLARGSTPVVAAKTIGFSIVSASNVVSNASSVSGSFPLNGNIMTTAAVADLGNLYLTATSTYPSTIRADEANKELWRFTATADDQDMEIRYLKLSMIGTVDVTDIKDLKLEVAGVQVGSTQQLGSDKTVTFDLASTPIAVTNGQSKIIALKGSMNGGSGRTFKFTIQKISDIIAYDTEYGVYTNVAAGSVTGAFQVVQPTSGTGTSVNSGTLTVGVDTTSPTGSVPDAATNLTLAVFSFAATGEAVKIDNLNIDCNGTGGTEVLANVKLLLDGSQIGTTDSALTCDNGTDSTTFTFGNTFIIPSGATKKVTVVADTTGANIAAADSLTVSLNAGSGNATGQTTYTSISSTAQAGRTLTINSGALEVVKNTALGNKSATTPSGTVTASNVKIGSFVVTAGAGEAVDITQIGLADDATTQLGDNFQNLKLMTGTTQIGSTIGTLNTTAGTYTFTPSSAIRLTAGSQMIVDVYADIMSSPADSAMALAPVAAVDSVTATGVTTSADASHTDNVDLQTAYISAKGNLTVTIDADTPAAANVVEGSTEVTFAKFKLAADAAEDILVTDMTVSDLVSSAATGTVKNLKLFVDGAQIGQTTNIGGTSTTTHANADFTSLNLTIPRNGSKVVTVKADITTYDDGADSGSTHDFNLLIDKGSAAESISARGVSSGAAITGAALDYTATSEADVSANTMTVYRTNIVVAWDETTPSGATTGGTQKTVAVIRITNVSNVGSYDATIETMNLNISQTGVSNTADRTLKIYKDSVITANLLATTSWVEAGNENFGDTMITTFTDVVIAANSSKLFIATLDTNDAGSTDSISIGVGATDISWGDGDSTGITAVNSLPLVDKTLTY